MRLAALLVMTVGVLGAETFPAVHLKTAWFDGQGTVEINDDGITFQAKKPKHSRKWTWLDIQYFDRISEKEFNILTYEDQKRYFGRDRSYRFQITGGTLTDDLFRRISEHLARPVTNRVIRPPEKVLYEVPVKHLHTFGGCEGVLRFTAGKIYYVTDNAKDAREWQLDRDVNSVWSDDTYRLSIDTYDNNRREFSRTRVYQFDLKAPLDAAFYRELKLKLYHLESAHLPITSGPAPVGE